MDSCRGENCFRKALSLNREAVSGRGGAAQTKQHISEQQHEEIHQDAGF